MAIAGMAMAKPQAVVTKAKPMVSAMAVVSTLSPVASWVKAPIRPTTVPCSPTIVALREKLDKLKDQELERFDGRLRDLAPEQRKAVEELASSLLNKVLHGPIRHLKRTAAASNGADRAALIRQLFGLGGTPEPPEAAQAPAEPEDGDEAAGEDEVGR